MRRMRALGAIAALIFGIASIAVAHAADFSVRRGIGDYIYYPAIGRRAAPLIIYDDQPGVIVRAYWRAPWRHRHYYPATGRRPRIGRLEHLSARRVRKPAESYHRYWSTSSALLPELPRGRARDYDVQPAPRMERPLK
jgi:hypothetical protein